MAGNDIMENWLIKQVKLAPHRLALMYEDKTWTFKQLQDAVYRIAKKLVGFDKRLGKRTALITGNTPASYFMILALQQIGVQPVLLNFRLAFAELERQRKDAGVVVMFVDDSLKKQFSEFVKSNENYYFISEIKKFKTGKLKIIPTFEDESIASIMYTSGTTGRPHGVLQTYRNHFFSAIGSVLNLGLEADDQWLCAVPIFHVSGLSIMMRSLIYGTGVVLVPHFDPVKISELLATRPISIMSVVPVMLKRLLEVYPSGGYNNAFRTFLLGGAPIAAAILNDCRQKKISVIQSYGMTETCSQIVALNFADAPSKIGAVGKPLFPVEVRIKGRNHIGEVEVKGPNVARSYLNDQAGFEAKLTPDGWFKTGDIGFFDEEGFLFIKGRKDEMFISGGENVFPTEIEKVYSRVAGIKAIAVVGVFDKEWGQVPCAFVETEKDFKLKVKKLKNYGRKFLAHYKVPQRFVVVPQLPRTASGKVKHAEIEKLLSRDAE
ncbi:Acyl-CoA synthetase (AMP-forming) AMP-acid ligase II [Liquorilactobacillus sucicola DSM 21376 = JCM 15457]|uniref:2-succinylbenzoate--CoA ligase n=2 Tax=Liquorilactobacillus sucicola TaxID=519050 RepID=A0A0R2DRW8_9LACO|nr:Acyl-CoA synthetase (AMP-forming) AMP-acid ligase II [Liquorilactobacillus sucicola DSM 21376 = JCM 15457]